MSKGIISFLKILWKSMIFWSLALACYAMFRFYGIDDEPGVQLTEEFQGTKAFIRSLSVLMSLGAVLGVLYASIDFMFEKLTSKRLTLGITIFLKSIIYFVFTIIVFTVTLKITSTIFGIEFNTESGWWLQSPGAWVLIFYILMASIVFSFIKIATERFGPGVFVKMLLGHYKNPREEDRIFMFLDLKNSTAIAETLGYHKHSQFLQDCFYDLNKVVLKYDAEIYQYVGDEAVLSWPYKKGIANSNCVVVFFAFEAERKSREAYYMENYGIFPEFKAGLHGGTLMAAEVGFVKKELAYHGDVINTSARIQAECNKHNVPLLLSETIRNELKGDLVLKTTSLGNILLKGKQKEVAIHAVSKL